jgi:tRNA pseudouridine38-40 synthase
MILLLGFRGKGKAIFRSRKTTFRSRKATSRLRIYRKQELAPTKDWKGKRDLPKDKRNNAFSSVRGGRVKENEKMPEEKNIKLILEYDGSRYHGWQRQTGMTTIQEVVEEKIKTMTGETVNVIASGRTDAGVHALYQVANFKTCTHLPPVTLRKGLNALLPEDIFVKQVDDVPMDFNSRYSAKTKIYEYRILNRKEPDIFLRLYAWHISAALNLEKMARCLSQLLGRHDFTSFKSSGSGIVNPVREMTKADMIGPEDDLLHFLFEADGFMRHMVRNIIGTVVEVGRGKIDVDAFMDIFHSRDRKKAGLKAPPQGLFLKMVKY